MAASNLPELSRLNTGDFSQDDKAVLLVAADATALLGQMYVRGDGVPQNNRTALEHFRRAAHFGSSSAMVGLAKMYQTGNDVLGAVCS
jgi:TPR repeat protein